MLCSKCFNTTRAPSLLTRVALWRIALWWVALRWVASLLLIHLAADYAANVGLGTMQNPCCGNTGR
jgi:hypothetical protein